MELRELCAKYGENVSIMNRYCRDGKIPARKIKNHWHIKVGDYLIWKKAQAAITRQRINNKQCRKCRYSMQFLDATHYACNYLETTGHMRNCPTYPKCEKFEPKTKKGL